MLVDPSKGLDILIDVIDLFSALDKLFDMINLSKGRSPVEFCSQLVRYPMKMVSKRSMTSISLSNTM